MVPPNPIETSPLLYPVTHLYKRVDNQPKPTTHSLIFSAEPNHAVTTPGRSIQQTRTDVNPSLSVDKPSSTQHHRLQPSCKSLSSRSYETSLKVSQSGKTAPSGRKNQSPLLSVAAVTHHLEESTENDVQTSVGSITALYSPEIPPTASGQPIQPGFGLMSSEIPISKKQSEAIPQQESFDSFRRRTTTSSDPSNTRPTSGISSHPSSLMSPKMSVALISPDGYSSSLQHSRSPSLGASLGSPPSSSSGRSTLWGRKVCSPLLRRQKTRDFFTAVPDKWVLLHYILSLVGHCPLPSALQLMKCTL